MKLSPAFFRQFSAGELRTRVEGISRIQQQFTLDLMRTILVGLAATVNLGLMFYYSLPLGGIALLSGMVVLGGPGLGRPVAGKARSGAAGLGRRLDRIDGAVDQRRRQTAGS